MEFPMKLNDILRKAIAVLTVTSCMWLAAAAQNVRSLSVWKGGAASEYAVYSIDSLSIRDDGSMRIVGLYDDDTLETTQVDSVTIHYPDIVSTNQRSIESLREAFDTMNIKAASAAFKAPLNHNPLMGHKFGADPFGMEDGGRMYVYMTDDHLYRSTNGEVIKEQWDYSDCKMVTIISSDDLVNWTDHGTQPVAGSGGPASWASQMWAPCAAHKTINGKEQYFLYFSNSNNGIGVLVADGPYGPWKQPANLNGALITRSTPNCSDVLSVYDPAVLIDDDGKAYIYFGGGFNDDNPSDPGTARCVQLGDDMVSIVGTPVKINPPYLFEDAGINKVGGKYLYSYCSNFKAGNEGPGSGNVGYMKSDSPLGPFTYVGNCFDNPGGAGWAGGGGNHHHAFIKFQGKYYALYHTRTLKSAMRSSNPDINDNVELRSTCLSELKVNETNATITRLTTSDITKSGVKQLKRFDPYRKVPGATMAWEYNVTTTFHKGANPSKTYTTAEMKTGSWMCLSNVDLRNGPVGFTAEVKGKGSIKICSKYPDKKGTICVLAEVPNYSSYKTITVPVVESLTGVREKFYIVAEGDISIKSWSLF